MFFRSPVSWLRIIPPFVCPFGIYWSIDSVDFVIWCCLLCMVSSYFDYKLINTYETAPAFAIERLNETHSQSLEKQDIHSNSAQFLWHSLYYWYCLICCDVCGNRVQNRTYPKNVNEIGLAPFSPHYGIPRVTFDEDELDSDEEDEEGPNDTKITISTPKQKITNIGGARSSNSVTPQSSKLKDTNVAKNGNDVYTTPTKAKSDKNLLRRNKNTKNVRFHNIIDYNHNNKIFNIISKRKLQKTNCTPAPYRSTKSVNLNQRVTSLKHLKTLKNVKSVNDTPQMRLPSRGEVLEKEMKRQYYKRNIMINNNNTSTLKRVKTNFNVKLRNEPNSNPINAINRNDKKEANKKVKNLNDTEKNNYQQATNAATNAATYNKTNSNQTSLKLDKLYNLNGGIPSKPKHNNDTNIIDKNRDEIAKDTELFESEDSVCNGIDFIGTTTNSKRNIGTNRKQTIRYETSPIMSKVDKLYQTSSNAAKSPSTSMKRSVTYAGDVMLNNESVMLNNDSNLRFVNNQKLTRAELDDIVSNDNDDSYNRSNSRSKSNIIPNETIEMEINENENKIATNNNPTVDQPAVLATTMMESFDSSILMHSSSKTSNIDNSNSKTVSNSSHTTGTNCKKTETNQTGSNTNSIETDANWNKRREVRTSAVDKLLDANVSETTRLKSNIHIESSDDDCMSELSESISKSMNDDSEKPNNARATTRASKTNMFKQLQRNDNNTQPCDKKTFSNTLEPKHCTTKIVLKDDRNEISLKTSSLGKKAIKSILNVLERSNSNSVKKNKKSNGKKRNGAFESYFSKLKKSIPKASNKNTVGNNNNNENDNAKDNNIEEKTRAKSSFLDDNNDDKEDICKEFEKNGMEIESDFEYYQETYDVCKETWFGEFADLLFVGILINITLHFFSFHCFFYFS